MTPMREDLQTRIIAIEAANEEDGLYVMHLPQQLADLQAQDSQDNNAKPRGR